MKTSASGIAFIRQWEGCKLKAYRDSVGVLTIGVGHTSAAGLPEVHSGMTITEQDALDILARDLGKVEAAVMRLLRRTPNQNQFDAMVSLAFNIGTGGFGTSSVARHFNEGNLISAAKAFALWNKGTVGGRKVEIQGLTNRRAAEADLFRTPVPDVPIVVQGDLMVLPPDVAPVEEGAVEAPPATLWAWFRQTFLW